MADLTEYVQAAARALRDVGGPNGPAAGSTRRCPMSKPEHIEALARALVPGAWDDNSDGLKSDLRRAALRAMGGRFFAAVRTDPAVQDAMLAALAEGGRLVEERRQPCSCGSESVGPCGTGHLLADAHTSLRERARYVTQWREGPDA